MKTRLPDLSKRKYYLHKIFLSIISFFCITAALAQTTTTTISSNSNPSCRGANIILTATITPGAAPGTVTFFDGTTNLGSSAVSAGVATLNISTLTAGSHLLKAVYSGGGTYTGSTSSVITQNVNTIPAVPGIISGPGSVCAGTAGLIYSINAVPTATSYLWTFPANWTVTAGAGSTSVTVTATATAVAGNIMVEAINACGSSAPTQTINLSPLNAANNTGYVNATTKFSDAITTSATAPIRRGYVKFPLGALSVIPLGSTITSAVLKVTNIGTSGSSGTPNTVTALDNNDPLVTSGATLYTAAGSGTIYNSSVWSILTGQLPLILNAAAISDITNRIGSPDYIAMGLVRGSGAAIYNFYGYSGGVDVPLLEIKYAPVRSLAITINPAKPAAPGAITGPNPACPNTAGNVYSVAAVANATSYNWNVPAGWTITGGQNSSSITVTAGPLGGSMTVTASNTCGTSVAGPPLNITMGVIPTVNAAPATQPNVCSGVAIGTITNTGSNAASFTWSRTDIINLTGMPNSGTGATINGTLTNSTGSARTETFTINSLSAGGCISAVPAIVTVTVNPRPAANAGPDQGGCTGGATIGGTPTASGGSPAYGYAWTPALGLSSTTIANPLATPLLQTTYTVTVTDSKGCQATDAVDVYVGVTTVNKTWVGSGSTTSVRTSTDFNDPLNWNPVGVPGPCNHVIMNIDIVNIFNVFGGNLTITFSANATIKSMAVDVAALSIFGGPVAFKLELGSRTLNILSPTTTSTLRTSCTSFFGTPASSFISVGAGGVLTYGGSLTTTVLNNCTNYPFYATNNNTGKMYLNGASFNLGGIGPDGGNKPSQVIFNGIGTQTVTNSSGAQAIFLGGTSTEIGETKSPSVVLTGAGTGGFINVGDLNINNTSILDVGATQTMNRNSPGGTINMAGGSYMKLGRNTGGTLQSNFPAAFAAFNFSPTSTVEYNGSTAQTVSELPSYGNLTLSNGGAKTAGTIAGNTVNVQNNINIQGAAIFTGASSTINLGGNWTNYNQGGFNEQTSVVNFNGGGAQTINTPGGEIFYTLNKSGAGTTTQLSNVAVQGGGTSNFTLSNGTYDAQTFTFSGTGPLNISNGLLKLAKIGAPSLPEFSAAYNLTGGTIELYGTGNQVLLGGKAYRNLTFSTSGIKTVTSAPTSITGTILTQNSVVLDVANNSMGGGGTNLTMTGTSVYKTAGTSTKPDATGTYTLGTGTTIEFTNMSALTTEDIRLTAPTYYNVVVSGTNVANPSGLTGIKFQGGGTFTVKNGGVFKLGSSAGFSGALAASVSNANNPNIVLEDGSTVQYYGGVSGTIAQAITNVIPYSNLIFSGASLKTAPVGTVTVTGNLTNTGSAFAHNNGTFLFNNGTAIQNYNSTGTPLNYYNITVSNPVNLNINNDLSIAKQLSLSTVGKLNLVAGNVTLKSDLSNTANVDKILINDAISYGTGNFIVERYLPAGTGAGQHNKSWQFLGVPVRGSQTVKAAWQEGAATPNANPNPGYGTQITSNFGGSTAGATALGFDVYTAAGPTVKTFDAASVTWVGIPNTISHPIPNQKGYMVFVRGDRGVTAFNQGATPTTLRTTGKLFAPSVTPANMPPSTSVGVNKFESIGNPYASAIDFTLLARPGVDAKFYVWDPLLTANVNGLGGYQTITQISGWKATPGGTANYNSSSAYSTIQSGQAFLVYSTGTGGSVSFTEASKINSNAMVFRPSASEADRQLLRLELYNNGTAGTTLADGNLLVFDSGLSNDIDADDAVKMMNTGENIGIRKAEKSLVIEARKPVEREDTVFYNISNLKIQPYQIRFDPENLYATGMTAFLGDKFLHATADISLDAQTTVDISVTSDPASSASDRFYVVFRPAIVVPVSITKISATRNSDASISVAWNVENETNMDRYELERSADGRSFDKINVSNLLLNNGGTAGYSHIDKNPNEVDNLYRVKAVGRSGQVQYSAIVKVAQLVGTEGISVYPNPVVGGTMNIYFMNQAEGDYKLQLSNKAGQTVYRAVIPVAGLNVTIPVKVGKLSKGNYQLTVISHKGVKTIQQVSLQ